jgi:ATP-dependent helicase HrpB
MVEPSFPITALLPRICDSLAAHPRLVLEAPPGAGKTTQVPLALLDAPWLGGRKILMLEPRRVAARAAAGFMARQLGEPVGETVGYRIRFESRISARTRIEVVTEGILTRMIQDDPMLEGVGALLFDEFHERHLSSDLGLALALDVQSQLRDDLRIVLMSATLDGERLSAFLDAPRLSSEGRSFAVAVSHFPSRRDEPLQAHVRRAVERALDALDGDILVFLPGQREIAQALKALALLSPGGVGVRGERSHTDAACDDTGSDRPSSVAARHLLPRGDGRAIVLPLHGELPLEQQSAALAPDPLGRRRIVLATNVAESSVTLPSVRVVIDAGLAREPRYDPNSGFSRLETVAISQASADQRAGRAGRVAEGWCYRLWPESQRMEPQRRAEITQVELSGLALELAGWGAADGLRFVETPPPGAMAAARELLQRLGALDAGKAITQTGRRMLALGTHPRLAAMLLAPADANERALACDLAALVEARDPLRDRSDDIISRWRALAAFRAGRMRADGSRGAFAAIDQAARQWRRRLRLDADPPRDAPAHLLGDLLLHAFPDRIGHQSGTDPRRYQLANGRSARLLDDSALYGEPWIVATELRSAQSRPGERGDPLIQRAASLDEARLERDFPQRFVSEDRVFWDADKRGIAAVRERRFDRIVLETKPIQNPDPSRYADALLDAVPQLGLSALPWSVALTQWRERVRCLRVWIPDTALPDLSDAALLASADDWLRPALAGKSRLDALDEVAFSEALQSRTNWSARQRIDVLAPTRIKVPSGMERAIAYRYDDHANRPDSPILAVKLQELFGLADTPRIADGRIAVTLHLLSPGGKPLQITQDLRGFWERTYPDVRKEMKGRYPRHPWPLDPWNAVATHRAKPRGT